MSALLKCHVTKSGNIMTPKGRMAYPAFFKPVLPKGETDKEKERYQGSLAFAKDADLSVLNAAVEQCAVEKWGAEYKKKYKVKKPFLKTEDSPKMGLDPEVFPIFIRSNSKDRPQIVTAGMANVDESKSEAVYPGRWARYSLRPYAYDHPTGGKGISLGLQNVQLLEDDEPLAAMRVPAEQEFDAIESEAGVKAESTDSLFE